MKEMNDFYLAFVISGFIGLFVGYVWGGFDGFREGYQRGTVAAEIRLRAVFKAKTDNSVRTPENG